MLRQAFLLMIPLVLGWIAWQLSWRGRGRRAVLAPSMLAGRMALVVVVLAVCIAPWTIRNYRAFGQFVLLNTNAGFVFYWGNHPIHGTEFIPILSGEATYGALLPRGLGPLNEAQLDRELLVRGLGFVREDPVRYLRLSVSRAKEYFKFWPSADSGLVSNLARVLSFGLALPFLVSGVVLALARRTGQDSSGASLLLLLAAAYSFVHLATWTLIRYRLPVDAILIPFAALSIVTAYQWIAGSAFGSNLSLRDAAN